MMNVMAAETLRKARLDELAPFPALLEFLRSRSELIEQRTVGTFHRGSRTFVHFHADDTVLADVKIDGEWQRVAVEAGEALISLVAAERNGERHG